TNSNSNCCDGKDACKLDISGLPRCYGGVTTACPNGYTGVTPCCIAAGQHCAFTNQCCTGASCLPGSDGGLSCEVPTCKPAGSACAMSSECCMPLGCVASACRMAMDAGMMCKADGVACTNSTECCSMTCTNGTCGMARLCQ